MPAGPRAKTRLRTPRQARAIATRDAILEAAARILARGGWDALTTNAIAARAGVSIGSLYEYFPDKRAIADALLERHLAAGEETLRARAASLLHGVEARPLREVVAALVDGFVALHAADPKLHRVLSSEVPLSKAVRARVAALTGGAAALVADVLRRHPQARAADPDLAGRLMVDACDALTHRWIVDAAGAPLPAHNLAAELTDLLVRYVAKR